VPPMIPRSGPRDRTDRGASRGTDPVFWAATGQPERRRKEPNRELARGDPLGDVPAMVEVAGGGNARMTATVEAPDTVTIVMEGELDIASVELIRRGVEPYLEETPQKVVFDVARLQFMDSSGIALLIEVSNRVDSVEIRHATPIVRRVLEVTGLIDVLGVTD